jgi:hypothetical protein
MRGWLKGAAALLSFGFAGAVIYGGWYLRYGRPPLQFEGSGEGSLRVYDHMGRDIEEFVGLVIIVIGAGLMVFSVAAVVGLLAKSGVNDPLPTDDGDGGGR